ncbi:abscisic acid 8'-hydroxylase 4 [Tanacetum coccineum]
MAIVIAVHKWKPYLLGRKFTVITDQKSLKFLLEQWVIEEDHQRWISILCGYDFEIMYRPGKENGDSYLTNLRNWIEDKEDGLQGYSVVNGVVLFNRRVVIPQESHWVGKLFQEYHGGQVGGHEGTQKTYQRLASEFYWTGMKADVAKRVAECDVCQRNKSSNLVPAGLLQPLNMPECNWKDITMDFAEGLPRSKGFSVVFVVVDRLSKSAHFIPLKYPFTGDSVAGAYIREVVRLHGIPQSILLDRDKRLKAWVKWLPWAEYWCNTSYHSSLQTTPFRVLYGRDPPTLLRYDHGSAVTFEGDRYLVERNELMVKLTVMGKRNEKLSQRIYGPYSMIERVGVVAYKLQLPEGARIHPVFHVSQLKRALGDGVMVSTLSVADSDEGLVFAPATVLDVRMEGRREVLIAWQGMPSTEVTWEGFEVMMQQFPSFHLEDKKEKRRNKQRARLPPGSLGWPCIGETLQMYSQDPSVFFASRQKRYGDIFKTRILGYPCVMLASPEAARFVLVEQPHLFKPTYPKSKENLIGPSALFFHTGNYHARMRKLVQASFSPEVTRKLIPDINRLAISSLESWANGQVINTFHEMKKFAFEVGILSIFGQLNMTYTDELKELYSIIEKGYNCFPTKLPGTAYHRSLMARRRLSRIFSEIMREIKDNKLLANNLMGHLLNFRDEKGIALSDEQIADNIIGVLFAAQDTTASVLTWILKYLSDDPKLLDDVKEEQKAVCESEYGENQALTWSMTRQMPLTYRVILESLRKASIISFTFREATVDVVYDGYLIPKGWKVMPLFRNIHHNPEFFNDPENFDPFRFENPPKPNTYMPFGNGIHACPGNELAKLEMLVLLHHMLTKYRWELVGSSNLIQYSPFPIPENGLRARFTKEI